MCFATYLLIYNSWSFLLPVFIKKMRSTTSIFNTQKKHQTKNTQKSFPQKTFFHLSVGCLLEDFHGGEFIFEATANGAKDTAVMAVEPKAGRVVLFSSDAENPHKAPWWWWCEISSHQDTNFNGMGIMGYK